MIKEFLEIGQIVSTHGVKGELRVQAWCDSSDFMKKFNTLYLKKAAAYEPLEVVSCRPHKNLVLMVLKDIDTMEKAQALKNRVLFMKRADAELEDGRYFIQELYGCHVFDAENGREYGVIEDVSETGANDVWHIVKDGNEYLIPAIPSVVVSVNVAEDKVLIHPLKGLFEEV